MTESDPEIAAAIEKFSQEMQLPKELYLSILVSAIEPTKEDLHKLEVALNAGDWEEIHSLAHRLKGTYGNLRLENLANVAVRMNDAASRKESIEEMRTIVQEFSVSFNQLCKALA
jgi:HPt (histidine-containing phosphotransfer) domain-containing protein